MAVRIYTAFFCPPSQDSSPSPNASNICCRILNSCFLSSPLLQNGEAAPGTPRAFLVQGGQQAGEGGASFPSWRPRRPCFVRGDPQPSGPRFSQRCFFTQRPDFLQEALCFKIITRNFWQRWKNDGLSLLVSFSLLRLLCSLQFAQGASLSR